MPATISIAPPPISFAHDPLWVQIQSGFSPVLPAFCSVVISGSGPSNGQTLRLQFAGRDLTFTARTTPGADNPFDWPLFTTGTLAQYADTIADRLRACEAITEYFDVQRATAAPDEGFLLVQKVLAPVIITVTETMSNVAAIGSVLDDIWDEKNLRMALQVWKAGATTNEDTLLAAFQAPYRTSDAAVDIDISAAFVELQAHLPPASSLVFTPSAGAGHYGEAPTAWAKFFLRYADKYGNPATARLMAKSANSYAIHGAVAGDGQVSSNISLRHNYRGRDLQPFRKPVVCDQPDWVFLWTGDIDPDTSFFLSVEVLFDDGTTQTVAVTESNTYSIQPNRLYWIVSGFKQLGLDTITLPPGATAIVQYDWRMYPPDLGDNPMFGPIRYLVVPKNDHDWFLAYDNGVGGVETVALRGPRTARYEVSGETYERPRVPDWTPEVGDVFDLAKRGKKSWEVNTGCYDRHDPYLEHLLQVPLADAWLMDMDGQRYLRVRVEGREMVFDKTDDTLVSLTLTVRASWKDAAYNI